jgi:hypothetical protein
MHDKIFFRLMLLVMLLFLAPLSYAVGDLSPLNQRVDAERYGKGKFINTYLLNGIQPVITEPQPFCLLPQ